MSGRQDSTEEVKNWLLALRARKGYLDAELVVLDASPEDHPHHHRFEWDDEVAGDKWRAEQARCLIRGCRMVYADSEGEPTSIRAFASIRSEDTGRHQYHPVEEIAMDPERRAILLSTMRHEWASFKKRYMGFDEFAEMVSRDMGKTA